MEIKRAGDLMIPLSDYPHIPYWFTLREAVAMLERSVIDVGGRQSLPRSFLVFNEAYELLGILRRRDILRGLGPRFMLEKGPRHPKSLFEIKADPSLLEMDYDKALSGLEERAGRPVAEFMSPVTRTLQFDDHLMTIVYDMVDADMSMIPVLKDGAVVGVVRSVDVLNEVGRLVL